MDNYTVLACAAHPTRELIVTGGMDKDGKTIRVWEHQKKAAAPPAAAPAAS